MLKPKSAKRRNSCSLKFENLRIRTRLSTRRLSFEAHETPRTGRWVSTQLNSQFFKKPIVTSFEPSVYKGGGFFTKGLERLRTTHLYKSPKNSLNLRNKFVLTGKQAKMNQKN